MNCRDLRKDTFYQNIKTHTLYFYDGCRLECCTLGTRFIPSHNIPSGLSSRHDDKIEVDNLESCDPRQYLAHQETRVERLRQYIQAKLEQTAQTPDKSFEPPSVRSGCARI